MLVYGPNLLLIQAQWIFKVLTEKNMGTPVIWGYHYQSPTEFLVPVKSGTGFAAQNPFQVNSVRKTHSGRTLGDTCQMSYYHMYLKFRDSSYGSFLLVLICTIVATYFFLAKMFIRRLH